MNGKSTELSKHIGAEKDVRVKSVVRHNVNAKTAQAEVSIKPLSVNRAWRGRTFKSDMYKKYEKDLIALLPTGLKIPEGELYVEYEFGISSRAGDWDNPIKPMQDILQAKYGFNDKWIMEAKVKKVIVKKGSEYIKFSIHPLSGK